MAHTRRTLQLDKRSWDISLDGNGRIRTDNGENATAQNIANEARLFTEDAYFNQDQGIPHFIFSFKRGADLSILRSYLKRAALSLPDVREVLSVEIHNIDPVTRTLSGEIQFTTMEGTKHGAVRTYF